MGWRLRERPSCGSPISARSIILKRDSLPPRAGHASPRWRLSRQHPDWAVLLAGLFVYLVCSNPLFAQQTYYLPHIANGQFADGSIHTTFVLFNTGDKNADVTMSLTREDGTAFETMLSELGPGSEFAFALDAGASLVAQTDGTEPLTAGAARITSTVPINASAIFSVYDSNGGFLTEAGVGSSAPLAEFVVPVDTSGAFDTGLALFNFNAGAATVSLQLINQSGQPQGTAVQNLAGQAKLARFVSEFFPGLHGFQGTLRVSSNLPLASLTIRQNSQPLSFTTLPVVPANSSQLDFNLPQIADGQFGSGSMQTTLLLFNLSSIASDVTLTFTRDDGLPFAVALPGLGFDSTFRLRLAPGASSFLQTGGLGELTSGAARLTSDAPIGVSAIFTVYDTHGNFLTEAGVSASGALETATIPVEENGSHSTGVAFFNPGAFPVTVNLALIGEGGERTGDAVNQVVPGGGHVARFVADWFPGTSEFRGALGISVSAPVAALTLRQNATPLSFTTLPVGQGSVAPLQGEGILLNEVSFNPAATQPQFVELRMPADAPGRPAGFWLENEKGEQYHLPATLDSLPAGSPLLILFDGGNLVQGATVHADRMAFLNTESGSVRLLNSTGGLIDQIDWGANEPWGIPVGRGGVVFAAEPGTALARIPSSTQAFEGLDWIITFADQASPGSVNPAPGVAVLLPFHGAVSFEPDVPLSWYPVTGAVQYRVQVANESNFTAPVLDITVEAPPVHTGSLPPADYFWRVQAINSNGQASDFSPAPLLTITSGQSGATPSALQAGNALEVTLPVPLLAQRKDTRMLLLESSVETGPHAWDVAHPGLDEKDRADNGNCALASIAMIARYYGGNLSQDRIGYEMFKDRVKGPERDLNYGEGLRDEEVARGLSWALGATARRFVITEGDPGAATTFWNTVKAEIDSSPGRPLIGLIGYGPGKNANGHALVIRGYAEDAKGNRFLLVNDPFFGPGINPVHQYSLFPPFEPFSTGRWKGFVAVPLSGIKVPPEEPEIALDSDRDGVVDFDESKRFSTDPLKADTDQDELTDKNDIRYSVFGTLLHGYAYNWRKCKVGPCRVPMEKDPDSDHGGCYDGFEDSNHDGKRLGGFETSNFTRFDDRCHLKGVEVRNENWSFDTPSSVITWQSKVDARFCLGPLLPSQRTDPNALAGQAEVKWTASHKLRYTQFAGCGPFTITNQYDKTYSPNENSGSIGLVDRNSLSIAFFPRPAGVEVTPTYSEDPACAANDPDKPTVWPGSSTIWGGIGFNWPPWTNRLTINPKPNFNQSLTYPITNGSGKSTLWIWFPPNQGQASQPCELPPAR
jgi:hypothetical protein